MRKPSKQALGLMAWWLLTFLAAALCYLAVFATGHFYLNLNLPHWAPSAEVLALFWSVLSFLLAWAAWLVWRAPLNLVNRYALIIFVLQWVLAILWSWVFFYWHIGALALLSSLILWALVASLFIGFWRIHPMAGLLVVPQLVWVSFTTVLSFSVWLLNPQALG